MIHNPIWAFFLCSSFSSVSAFAELFLEDSSLGHHSDADSLKSQLESPI